MSEYALYKGDRFIDLGSPQRLSLVSGLSAETIERYSRKHGAKDRDCPYSEEWIVIKL